MKKNLHKAPLVVAVCATFAALLYLPEANAHRGGEFYEYRSISTLQDLHWLIFAVELLAIWGGFFLYKHITKPEENEYSRDKLAKVAQELSKDLLNQIEENKWKPK